MTADRALSPSDIAIALRSFPRRFRALFVPPEDDERFEVDEVARRTGSDGTTAVDRLIAAVEVIDMLEVALAAAPSGTVVLPPSFGDLGATPWADPGGPVPELLDRLDSTASATADRVDAIPAGQWGTPTYLAGSEPGDAMTAAQDAVAAVAAHLRATARVIEEVSR